MPQPLKGFPARHIRMYADAADISPLLAQTLILLLGYLASSIYLGFHTIYTLSYLGATAAINVLSLWIYGKHWLDQPTPKTSTQGYAINPN